jgi:uroporphyrinogen-III decarboxylase
MRGGKFILREGNNLAPGTPIENVAAMYEACKKFGPYEQDGSA